MRTFTPDELTVIRERYPTRRSVLEMINSIHGEMNVIIGLEVDFNQKDKLTAEVLQKLSKLILTLAEVLELEEYQ